LLYKLIILANFGATRLLRVHTTLSNASSLHALEELHLALKLYPTARSSLRLKRRQLSNIFSTSIHEVLSSSCARWQIWLINCWLHAVVSQLTNTELSAL
jgi:hypothetical protein